MPNVKFQSQKKGPKTSGIADNRICHILALVNVFWKRNNKRMLMVKNQLQLIETETIFTFEP